MHDHESFERASWLSMYHGFNVVPQRYDVRIQNVDVSVIEAKLAQMRNSMAGAAQQAMSHQDFISKHCRSRCEL